VSLVVALVQLWPPHFMGAPSGLFQLAISGMVMGGACAAAIGALLAWRGARSSLGTLRGVLD
jgi:hypothetical protein